MHRARFAFFLLALLGGCMLGDRRRPADGPLEGTPPNPYASQGTASVPIRISER